MKAYSYYWRMNLRRTWPCLLVVVFTAITSLFMFSYPQLIADTQQRLDEAYDSIVVKGWMSSASGFDDPIDLQENLFTIKSLKCNANY